MIKNDNVYFDKHPTRGRPKLVLNDNGKKLIERLASVLCTDEEIASVLGVSIETLQAKHNNKAFLEYKKAGQDKGKASLRRWQFRSAENGNASLLIWLGKQYLGQTDKQELEMNDNKDIVINVMPATKEDMEEEL